MKILAVIVLVTILIGREPKKKNEYFSSSGNMGKTTTSMLGIFGYSNQQKSHRKSNPELKMHEKK